MPIEPELRDFKFSKTMQLFLEDAMCVSTLILNKFSQYLLTPETSAAL